MDVVLIQHNQHNQDWRLAPRVCLEDYTDTDCIKKFCLNKDRIKVIINRLKDVLQSATNRNNPISPETKILASLRLLASGSFQAVTGNNLCSFFHII